MNREKNSPYICPRQFYEYEDLLRFAPIVNQNLNFTDTRNFPVATLLSLSVSGRQSLVFSLTILIITNHVANDYYQ